jgi:hypothetical protein
VNSDGIGGKQRLLSPISIFSKQILQIWQELARIIKNYQGTMEEKIKIIQTANTTEGTTIYLAPDVDSVLVDFNGDRLVSHVIIKMKHE